MDKQNKVDTEAKVAVRESYILFELAGTTYGVPSQLVQQMDMIEQITPVPDAPMFVEGVVFLRGQVVPVIDLRRRFGFESIAKDLRTRLIVIALGSRRVGLKVDLAREFVMIDGEAIQPPPEGIAGLSGRYVAGITRLGERVVIILDLDEVCRLDRMTLAEVSEN